MVFKIIFLLSPTPNNLEVDTLGNPIVKLSGTISVINRRGSVFILFPSLLRGFSIIGILRSWRLYYLGFGLSFYHLEVFYQWALGLESWQRLCEQHNCPIEVGCKPALALVLFVFFINPALLSSCRFPCYIQVFIKAWGSAKKSNKLRFFESLINSTFYQENLQMLEMKLQIHEVLPRLFF